MEEELEEVTTTANIRWFRYSIFSGKKKSNKEKEKKKKLNKWVIPLLVKEEDKKDLLIDG